MVKPVAKKTRWQKFADILFILAVINLLAYIVVGAFLGGIAVQNPSNDGNLYLAQGESLTAVSSTTYLYSQYHQLSVLITLPVALLLSFAVSRKRSSGKS